MTNNVNKHVLKDLFNLIFFSGKGTEIYMQKEYTIEWEFVPADEYTSNFMSVPKGFIAGEISEPNEDESEQTPRLLSLIIGVTDGGKFTNNSLDTNYLSLFNDRERRFGEFNSEYKSKIRFSFNNQTKPQTFELPLHGDNGDIFTFVFGSINIATSNEDKKYGYVSSVNVSNEQYIIDKLESNFKNIAFYFPFIKYVGEYRLETVSTGFIAADTLMVLAKNNSGVDTDNDLFHRPHIGEFVHNSENLQEPEFSPYVKVVKNIDVVGNIGGFNDISGEELPFTPLLGANSINSTDSLSRTFQMVFQPTNNSEIFIIDHDVNYNLILDSDKSKEFSVDLFNVDPQYKDNPITFAVGFRAQTEGCYQNFLGIYLRNLDNDQSFFIGVLNIKTQVEGEDERFRTLLENFGIPDPIKYSNIFKEVDYEEDGYDYKVINKKSKELFLTYDKIFSHIGTYKALLNAVKFLGYSDIIFKEWYKFRDVDNKMHNLAVRRVDLSTENYIKFQDEYGIDFEKYINYTKLNKLTMIYHLNELSEDENYIEYKQHFVINDVDTYQTQYYYDLIPNTVPVYELRNDEVLAKLFGVKEWLEAHIIGVGAYIADISGEGIYFGGVKNQLYSTMHHLVDYHEEEYVTPVITNVTPFKVFTDDTHTDVVNDTEYGTTVTCTLTEYTGLTFEDYKNVTFESFEKVRIPVNVQGVDHLEDENGLYYLKIGNPIDTPVLFDEIEYGIDVVNGSGTVTEFRTNLDSSSEMFVDDGEITLLSNEFNDNNSTIPEFTSTNSAMVNARGSVITKYYNAPTIFIETGTIRNNTSNDWLSNVIYSINEELSENGEVYNITNVETKESVISPKTIILKPHMSGSTVLFSKRIGLSRTTQRTYADFEYTMNPEDNKFGVPVILIAGYDVIVNDEILYTLNDKCIIDIVVGRIEFYKQSNDNGLKLRTEIFFSDDNRYNENDVFKAVENPREQVVTIRYEYSKDREQLIKYTSKLSNNPGQVFNPIFNSFDLLLKKLEQITEINAKVVDIPINRAGDYTVKVKTYDKFNNIFTAESDKVEHVETLPINVNVYIKDQDNSNNPKEIYPDNRQGLLVDDNRNLSFSMFGESNPKINYHYHSENIEFDYTQPNLLEYLNVTYALDTPKNNEHILLYPTKTSRPYKPNSSIFVGVEDLFGDNEKYYVFTDDYGDVHTVYDLRREGSTSQYIVPLPMEYYYNNFDITSAPYSNDENVPKSSIIINQNTEGLLNKTALDVFKVGDVIKITYVVTYHQYVPKTSNSSDSLYQNNVGEFTNTPGNWIEKKSFKNSLCYRIINIENNAIVLNGWLDEYLMGLNMSVPGEDTKIGAIYSDVKVYMSYPHEDTAYYDVEITEDADEYKAYVNDIPYLKTNVKFNDARLFLNDYLDNNYRLYLYDFDPTNFEKIWWKNITPDMHIEDAANYYKYVNFPVTYNRGSQVLVESTDDYFVGGVPYFEWIWQSYFVETGENYNEYKSEKTLNVLFRSTNTTLNVFPDMQGRQDIILKSIDKFGNIFKNNGEGLLFLK